MTIFTRPQWCIEPLRLQRQGVVKAGGRFRRPARSNASRSQPDAGFSFVAELAARSLLLLRYSGDPERKRPVGVAGYIETAGSFVNAEASHVAQARGCFGRKPEACPRADG